MTISGCHTMMTSKLLLVGKKMNVNRILTHYRLNTLPRVKIMEKNNLLIY